MRRRVSRSPEMLSPPSTFPHPGQSESLYVEIPKFLCPFWISELFIMDPNCFSLICPERWENINRGPTFGDFVTIAGHHSCKTTDSQSTRVQSPLSPSFKCNVLRDSLSVVSQNIPCATLKSRGVVGNLCISGDPARLPPARVAGR
jgi:hypothetical protein